MLTIYINKDISMVAILNFDKETQYTFFKSSLSGILVGLYIFIYFFPRGSVRLFPAFLLRVVALHCDFMETSRHLFSFWPVPSCFFFQHTNNAHWVDCAQQHCYDFLKTLYPVRIRSRVFCSCDVDCATPHGAGSWKMELRRSSKFERSLGRSII
jgi:hypothetical protein